MRSDSRSHELWDDLWTAGKIEQWDTLSQEILNSMHGEIGQVRGKRILEAGSGTGRVSLELARAGASLTLVDFSPVALDTSRSMFALAGLTAEFVAADMRAIPLPDGAYDVVWSGGVLEHYDLPEQATLLRELARLLKPGGKLIILTPYARCLPYRLGKWAMELTNRWRYGKEEPVWSLAPAFAEAGVPVTAEYPIAPLTAAEWAESIAPDWGRFLRCWAGGFPSPEQDAAPGYLLCTVGELPPAAPSAALDLRGWLNRHRPTLLMLSSVQWDDPWQRPQQMAAHLARMGARVLYVNSRPHLLQIPKGSAIAEAALRERIVLWLIQQTKWWRSIAIIEPLTGVTDGEQRVDATHIFLDALRVVFGLEESFVWTYHYIWNEAVAQLRQRHPIVYDCVDDHVSLGGNGAAVVEAHQRLVAMSDTLLLTSRPLLDGPLGRHPHVHLIRNGVDPEAFPLTSPRPDRPAIHVGFVGAISSWVDLEMVAAMARLRPDWRFTLVGPVYVTAHPLEGLPNVHLVGAVPHAELAGYHAQFDAAVIPFRMGRVAECANPIKLYEYLASGLPVVSTPLPEVTAMGPLVRTATTAKGFVQAVEEMVAADSPAQREARRHAVAGHTWTQRAIDAFAVTLTDALRKAERWSEADDLLQLILAEQ